MEASGQRVPLENACICRPYDVPYSSRYPVRNCITSAIKYLSDMCRTLDGILSLLGRDEWTLTQRQRTCSSSAWHLTPSVHGDASITSKPYSLRRRVGMFRSRTAVNYKNSCTFFRKWLPSHASSRNRNRHQGLHQMMMVVWL